MPNPVASLIALGNTQKQIERACELSSRDILSRRGILARECRK